MVPLQINQSCAAAMPLCHDAYRSSPRTTTRLDPGYSITFKITTFLIVLIIFLIRIDVISSGKGPKKV